MYFFTGYKIAFPLSDFKTFQKTFLILAIFLFPLTEKPIRLLQTDISCETLWGNLQWKSSLKHQILIKYCSDPSNQLWFGPTCSPKFCTGWIFFTKYISNLLPRKSFKCLRKIQRLNMLCFFLFWILHNISNRLKHEFQNLVRIHVLPSLNQKISLIHSESTVFLIFHVRFQIQFKVIKHKSQKVQTQQHKKICKMCSEVGLTRTEHVLLTLF